MGNLDIVLPKGYTGKETVRLAKVPDGPRDYVASRGADYVPTKTGPGDVHFVDDKFQGESLVFDGVNDQGRMALLNAAQGVVNSGQALTYRAVLDALRSSSDSESRPS